MMPIGRRHSDSLGVNDFYCLRLDSNGRLEIVLPSGVGTASADDLANPTAAETLAFPHVYDGATWDRLRGTSVAGAANIAEQLSPGYEDNTNGIAAYVPKPLSVSTYAATRHVDFGADPDVSVKASAGNVFAFACHNLNAAIRYAQLHNKASAPGAGETPLYTFLVPAGGQIVIGREFFGEAGAHFSTGIAFGFSTTEGTYTAGAATDQFTHIMYK